MKVSLDELKVELYKKLLSIPSHQLTASELNIMYELVKDRAIQDALHKALNK